MVGRFGEAPRRYCSSLTQPQVEEGQAWGYGSNLTVRPLDLVIQWKWDRETCQQKSDFFTGGRGC